MYLIRSFIIIVITMTCISCGITPSQYEKNTEKLSFDGFFNGRLCAWGTVSDSSEQVTRRFVVKLKASTEGDITHIKEVFEFSDGEIQYRNWQFKKQSGRYFGTAEDVVGQATGKVFGNSLNLKYQLKVDTQDSQWQLAMDDWLHLIDQSTLMGTTKMSKWGFGLGKINIVIQKRDSQDDCGLGELDVQA